MASELVSELTVAVLQQADEDAERDFQKLREQPTLEGVIKGEDRSGWFGIIHVGLWPVNGGFENRYIIHTSIEGSGNKARNVEMHKIRGFFKAKRVMRAMLDSDRTVYTPAIKGHKIIHFNEERDIQTRDIYVNYEPRILAYNECGITPKEFACFLGRDIARFMALGMNNAPRHIRPNFSRPSIRQTCMIDLDRFDPRTFYWNAVDRYPKDNMNYSVLLQHELSFLRDVKYYFLMNHLPKGVPEQQDIIEGIQSSYFDGFADEVINIKGTDAGAAIVDRFRQV